MLLRRQMMPSDRVKNNVPIGKRWDMAREPSPRDLLGEQLTQWQAARSSRRESEPEIVVVRRKTGWIWIWAISGLFVGALLGYGSHEVFGATAEPPLLPEQPSFLLAQPLISPPAMPLATPTLIPTRTPTPTVTPTSMASATPSPAPTMTPSASIVPTSTPALYAIVQARVLHVRAGPGVDYAVVGYSVAGQQFKISSQNEHASWYRIDFNGLDGWVSASWVEIRP